MENGFAPFFSVETYRLVPLSALAVVTPGSCFANWNSSFNPKPNHLSFYSGFTSFLADGPGQTPNLGEGSSGKTGA